MASVARLGDQIKHGASVEGSIVSVSGGAFIQGEPVASIGDGIDCSEHGPGTITEGSSSVFLNGSPVARIGDHTSCGAEISSGSQVVDAL